MSSPACAILHIFQHGEVHNTSKHHQDDDRWQHPVWASRQEQHTISAHDKEAMLRLFSTSQPFHDKIKPLKQFSMAEQNYHNCVSSSTTCLSIQNCIMTTRDKVAIKVVVKCTGNYIFIQYSCDYWVCEAEYTTEPGILRQCNDCSFTTVASSPSAVCHMWRRNSTNL